MRSTVFDYAIIGAGAAGLQLALAILDEPFFKQKKILILEKSDKNANDRTWCFWEKGNGAFDKITSKSWESAAFISKAGKKSFGLKPYRYKMLRAVDFYSYAKAKISKADHICWRNEEVNDLESGEPVIIKGKDRNYSARQVFDSRIDPVFFDRNDNYTRILQHFKGWIIQTRRPVFNPREFVMMDFRLKWKDRTSFTYVLPLSPRKALVEFTLFTPALIPNEDYNKMLHRYIHSYLNTEQYEIIETEQGIIPMSDYPFHKNARSRIMKIGTAGSWVKPSSGYSFKFAEKYARQIVNNLKTGSLPDKRLFKKRFRIYDSIFLEVLNKQNELGEALFTSMYHKNKIQQIFKFLDNETTLAEELKIIAGFQQWPFLKAFGRYLFR